MERMSHLDQLREFADAERETFEVQIKLLQQERMDLQTKLQHFAVAESSKSDDDQGGSEVKSKSANNLEKVALRVNFNQSINAIAFLNCRQCRAVTQIAIYLTKKMNF